MGKAKEIKTTKDIKKIAMVAKCGDGKVRQIVIRDRNMKHYLDAIEQIEGSIGMFEKPISSITLK